MTASFETHRGACHRARIRATRWPCSSEYDRKSSQHFRGFYTVIPGRCEASNYDVLLHIGESRDSPMCNCTSEVWSFGPSRNDS